MFPLSRQVQIATDHAKGATARLAGVEPPRFADDEKTFDELDQRIARTIDYISGIPAGEIEGSSDRPILLKLGKSELEFKGKSYLCSAKLLFSRYDRLWDSPASWHRHRQVRLSRRAKRVLKMFMAAPYA
jgi:hypothetical protein